MVCIPEHTNLRFVPFRLRENQSRVENTLVERLKQVCSRRARFCNDEIGCGVALAQNVGTHQLFNLLNRIYCDIVEEQLQSTSVKGFKIFFLSKISFTWPFSRLAHSHDDSQHLLCSKGFRTGKQKKTIQTQNYDLYCLPLTHLRTGRT